MLVAENKEEYNVFKDIVLKDEQNDAIDFILEKQNCILNLQPGTGKTMCGIAATARIMKQYNDVVTFIICPKAANEPFKKEFARTNYKYSMLTTGETRYITGSRYFIFNYSKLDSLEKMLDRVRSMGIRVIGLFDEAHILGSSTSGVSRTLNGLRDKFTCTILMTGTPLLNDLEGLYHVCHFCRPNALGQYWEFKRNWLIINKKNIRVHGSNRVVEEIVGVRDLDLFREILGKFIITRFREYNIDFKYYECTLTKTEMRYYRRAATGVLSNPYDEKDYSARLWDLQRVADGSAYEQVDGAMYSKNKLLLETVRECVQRNEAVIVYTEIETTYTKLYDLIKKSKDYIGYKRIWLITGKTDYSDRVKCERSLAVGDVVIITKAGNKSINLQAANNMVFYDIPFAVGDYIQCVGRITRTDTVFEKQNVYLLEAKETIDTYKKKLLLSHMDLIKQIFGKSSVMPYYSDADKDISKYKDYFKSHLLWCRDYKD